MRKLSRKDWVELYCVDTMILLRRIEIQRRTIFRLLGELAAKGSVAGVVCGKGKGKK